MINKLLTLFCLISFNLFGQSKNNVEDIFKMELFLNKKNTSYMDTTNSISKNDSLYKKFKEILNIKIEKLKIDNKLSGFLENDYQFFMLSEKNVSYNKSFDAKEYRYLQIEMMIDSYYILAINIKTGANYRLAGFDSNDFTNFLLDFKEQYLISNSIKLKNSTFFNKFKVEYLDFKCMYDGLKSEQLDREKFTCLKRCSDPFKIN